MAYTPTQSQLEQFAAEDALKQKMLTPEKFLVEVESYAKEYDLTIIDAIIHYCEDNDVDIELVSTDLLSDRLYALIEEDAEDKNLIVKRRARLQFT